MQEVNEELGNRLYHGVPALLAMAAYRTGVDLVYLAVPEVHESSLLRPRWPPPRRAHTGR